MGGDTRQAFTSLTPLPHASSAVYPDSQEFLGLIPSLLFHQQCDMLL